jgi:rSAM/selenodomain-associated transferase 1
MVNVSDATTLIVFVKAPRHGAVKTRLAKTLGASAALDIYNNLVRSVLGTFSEHRQLEVCYSPDDALDEIKPWLRPNWTARPQGPGDLGQKMFRSFCYAFGHGTRKAIIIGSDCPELTTQDIQQAAASLDHHDLVLGPSEDGGYWLIGLKKTQSELFQNMPWSTYKVLDETIRRATALKLRIYALRVLRDIDTADDWNDYRARTAPEP